MGRRKGGACYSHKWGLRWRQPSLQCVQPGLCKYSGPTQPVRAPSFSPWAPEEQPVMALSCFLQNLDLSVKHTWLPTYCGGSKASRGLTFYLGIAANPQLPT